MTFVGHERLPASDFFSATYIAKTLFFVAEEPGRIRAIRTKACLASEAECWFDWRQGRNGMPRLKGLTVADDYQVDGMNVCLSNAAGRGVGRCENGSFLMSSFVSDAASSCLSNVSHFPAVLDFHMRRLLPADSFWR